MRGRSYLQKELRYTKKMLGKGCCLLMKCSSVEPLCCLDIISIIILLAIRVRSGFPNSIKCLRDCGSSPAISNPEISGKLTKRSLRFFKKGAVQEEMFTIVISNTTQADRTLTVEVMSESVLI